MEQCSNIKIAYQNDIWNSVKEGEKAFPNEVNVDTCYEVLEKMYNFYSKLTTNITLKEIDSYAEMILNYSIDNNEYYTLHGEDQKGELHDEFIVDQK